MGDGLYQSAVVFFIPYLVWTLGIAVSWNGKSIESLSDFGTTASVAAILAANTYVGINTNHWTIIIWIVVFGSMMLLWTTVYSFFFSVDFIDEVIILFGELTFWTTVMFSAAVALAPRYIVKFINSSYYPLDKDIVRDGKKGAKRTSVSVRLKIPLPPMFDKDHNRSASEFSQHNYEPALSSSPGTNTSMGRQTCLHMPPLDGIAEEMTPAHTRRWTVKSLVLRVGIGDPSPFASTIAQIQVL
ncbi:hypothetical protein BT96DRAFT_1010418 [Gymnopus androsaceus JB14]|uniref:P-type ATPase C-terminal domain-containing protein n=1 Tax=Gymnopus androsaceus JB14 TaxID=1447944 RepID=A0A6A4GAR7_9AGAR|nr:hypothetical protein BT96DRAFT_1010418 [Gymnopus androsaceus JB14]